MHLNKFTVDLVKMHLAGSPMCNDETRGREASRRAKPFRVFQRTMVPYGSLLG